MADIIECEILEDGRIKATTPTISQANHMGAEKFMAWIASQTGARPQITKRPHKHGKQEHHHEHKH